MGSIEQEIRKQAEQLFEDVEFGMEVEAFLSGRVGQYLESRCQEITALAINRLIDVHPEDTKKIKELQYEIKNAEKIMSWLRSSVLEGRNAAAILNGEAPT